MRKKNRNIFVGWSSADPGFTTSKVYMNPVVEKIRSFTNLKENWHFDRGMRIPEDNINAALELVEFLEKNSIINLDAFPGVNGEVQVTGYFQNGNFLEITINNTKSVDVVAENENDQELFSKYSISLDEGKHLINARKELLFFKPNSAPSWSTFASSVYTITTEINVDLQVSLSDRPQTAVSRLSKLVAQ